MQNEVNTKVDVNIIYGIDVAKGSSRARELPRYAVAILNVKEGDVTHHTMVRRHKILRMVHQDRPSIIAVDNVFELAANKKELIHFLERLPKNVKLVQVTGGLHQKPLVRLAREHGMTFNQFNPNEEAEVCAHLANLGVGCEVSLFEDVTKIKVSRARSLGRGGWSQNRYRRKVHGAVKVKSREVESILQKAAKNGEFTYTSKIVEGFGGYVRCEFTVNTRRDNVPIYRSTNADFQVNIKGVERDKIKYIPLKMPKRRFTIVGIDPGTTVGVAILSLDGELLLLKSSRGMSHDEVVKLIAEYGKPVIVATDVIPTPAAVEKIRRRFNAIIGTPATQFRADEKITLSRPFGYSNDHERDALAAALYTFKNYKNVFSRIEKKVPQNVDIDQVRSNVIRGDSIEEAIEKVVSASKGLATSGVVHEKVTENATDEDAQRTKMIENLKQKKIQIRHLQEYVLELKTDVSSKDAKIKKLQSKIGKNKREAYKKIRTNIELQIRDNKISILKVDLNGTKKALNSARNQIKKLKQIRKMEIKGEGIPVKIISSFTKEAIERTAEMYGIKRGDVVYLEDPSGGGTTAASILIDAGVRAVIVSDELSHVASDSFFEGNIPVLSGIHIQRVEDFAIVDPEMLNSAILEWEIAAQEIRMAQKEQQLKLLVDEYKSERRRGLV